MTTFRCAFVDENGVQCLKTTEHPFTDGWASGEWSRFYPPGYYCPAHAAALDEVEEEGGLDRDDAA